jgi:xanthine dehydrogenase molybdopterin-binding subunit B
MRASSSATSPRSRVAPRACAGVVLASDIRTTASASSPTCSDQPALAAEGMTRFRGEAVLVLAGEARSHRAPWTRARSRSTGRCCRRSNRLVGALDAGCRGVHARFRQRADAAGAWCRGDVDAALAGAPRRVSLRASSRLRYVEHAYIEPEAGGRAGRRVPPARPRARGRSPARRRPTWTWRRRLALDVRCAARAGAHRAVGGRRRLRRQARHVGAAAARVAAWRCKFGRPARVVYERPESMASSTKRHPAEITRDASRADRRRPPASPATFHGDFDTGAYASWGPTVANRVPVHAMRPVRASRTSAR